MASQQMNPSTELAREVVAQLVSAGVEDMVVSPGSRNTPLLLAAHRAASADRLTLHVRHDERVAGFTALGIARATGQPVVVVTTSGSAVGNLFPAVMEAAHSGDPLVVVSADRPIGMLDSGANQTTHQTGIFDHFVRAEATLAAGGGPLSVRHQVSRVLAAAGGVRDRHPGPGHLNVRFADPLVPDADENASLSWLDVDTPSVAPLGAGMLTQLEEGPRTVVLAGGGRVSTGARARHQAEQAGVPLLAGPASNARSGPAISTYRLLLSSPLADEIERVVVYGRPTLSRPVTRLLSRRDVEVVIVADGSRWSDVGLHASMVADEVQLPAGDPAWLEKWQDADAEAAARLRDLLDSQEGLTGPGVARAVVGSVRGSDILFLGNSQPIRDADLAPITDQAPRVTSNRGLSGIDGLVSTAIGVGLGVDRPVTALLGDVTVAYDSGGLLIGPGEEAPDIRLVIINDDGGAIFHTLEQGEARYNTGLYDGAFERLFGTPHAIDFASLAQAYGWQHQRIDTAEELEAALAQPVRGRQVIEVRVDRQQRRELEEQIRHLAQ